MAGVQDYSTSADANTSLFPENQDPSTVNNAGRQVQADLATVYNDPGWYRPGAPAYEHSYLSTSSFRVIGQNVVNLYHAERRVRAYSTLTGTVYGAIASSTYNGGHTDVSVTWDGAGIQSDPGLIVSLSIQPRSDVGGWAVPPSVQATTAHVGSVELATNAEVILGVDLERVITPSGLAAKIADSSSFATTTAKGIAELATIEETFTGTDTGRVVTPWALGFNNFKGVGNPTTDVGYMKHPGGLIEQFGYTTYPGAGNKTIVFPITYSFNVLSVQLQSLATQADGYIQAVAVTHINVFFAEHDPETLVSTSFYWRVIGY